MKKKGKILKSVNLALLVTILIFGYFSLFIAAYFSQPNAEDFSLTAVPKNIGVLNATIDLLINYDGRYFTNILHGINPMAQGWLEGYSYTIIFGVLLSVFSFYFFITSIVPNFSKYRLFLFSLLFMLVGFALSASIVHLVYWMVSSFVYLYSWSFWLLWMGFFLRSIESRVEKVRIVYAALSMILLICAMGINEMFLFINIASVFLLVLYVRVFKKVKVEDVFYLPLLFTALACVAFFISNPGIKRRFLTQTSNYQDFSLLSVILKATHDFGLEVLRIIFSGGIFIFFIIYILVIIKSKKGTIFSDSFFNVKWLSVGFFLIFTSTFAFYIPMGHENDIPVRIFSSINLLVLLWLTGFFVFSFSKIVYLINLKAWQNELVKFIALIGLSVSLIFSNNNISLILNDLKSGRLKSHHQEMLSRYHQFSLVAEKQNFCDKIVVLDTLVSKPNSIFHPPDIKANRSESYWNAAYEKYFNVREVRLTGDSIFMEDKILKRLE